MLWSVCWPGRRCSLNLRWLFVFGTNAICALKVLEHASCFEYHFHVFIGDELDDKRHYLTHTMPQVALSLKLYRSPGMPYEPESTRLGQGDHMSVCEVGARGLNPLYIYQKNLDPRILL